MAEITSAYLISLSDKDPILSYSSSNSAQSSAVTVQSLFYPPLSYALFWDQYSLQKRHLGPGSPVLHVFCMNKVEVLTWKLVGVWGRKKGREEGVLELLNILDLRIVPIYRPIYSWPSPLLLPQSWVPGSLFNRWVLSTDECFALSEMMEDK